MLEQQDYERRVYEQNIVMAHRTHDRLDEQQDQLADGAFKAADAGLRTSAWINGAAIVALLAFIGTILKEDRHEPIVGELLWSFWWFVGGVISSIASMTLIFGAYYLGSQSHAFTTRTYEENPYIVKTEKSRRRYTAAMICLFTAMAVGIASIGAFAGGCVVVYRAFSRLTS